MKNAVKAIMTRKIVENPKMNDKSSVLDLDFKLNATKIGMTGRMQGDRIDITPVKKEIAGRISI